MTQTQEHSAGFIVLEKQRKFKAKALIEGQKMPQQMVAVAEKKLAGFKILKEEIESEMQSIQDRLSEVRNSIRMNIRSEKNARGLLTQKEDDYLSCLELGQT